MFLQTNFLNSLSEPPPSPHISFSISFIIFTEINYSLYLFKIWLTVTELVYILSYYMMVNEFLVLITQLSVIISTDFNTLQLAMLFVAQVEGHFLLGHKDAFHIILSQPLESISFPEYDLQLFHRQYRFSPFS